MTVKTTLLNLVSLRFSLKLDNRDGCIVPHTAKPQIANGFIPGAARALPLIAIAVGLRRRGGPARPARRGARAVLGRHGQAVNASQSKAPCGAGHRRASTTPSYPARKRSGEKTAADRSASGPLVINVSLSRQRLTVYDAHGPIAESPVSSGRVGYSTPAGVYSIVQKKRQHYSNLYAGASMPNMQRITWSGVALHAGALPGYPASHGCIRLPHGFSSKLFGMTTMGTRVIVSREPVRPVSIEHDRLFAAFPPEPWLPPQRQREGRRCIGRR